MFILMKCCEIDFKESFCANMYQNEALVSENA